MNSLRAVSLWAASCLVACASEAPAGTSFDSSAGLVVVYVLGDGFVRCEERRVPLEAIVLELRQRTRRMTREELTRFVVHLRVDPLPGPQAATRAQEGMNRLVDELHVMGVPQVKYL